MAKTTTYGAETKAKAIRLVRGHAGDCPSQWAAISAVASRLGMSAEMLRKWLRQAETEEAAGPDHGGGRGDPGAAAEGLGAGADHRYLRPVRPGQRRKRHAV
jgi:transposase-like protein